MPVPVGLASSSDEPPALRLSWSSLDSSSSGKVAASRIAHSPIKRNRQSIVAQVSKDKVCLLLDGVQLVKTLPFWSSYEDEERERGADIECVCISENATTAEVFVAAAADDCIVVWSTTSTFASGKNKWQVHSRLHVGQGKISSIDMQKDLLLVGSANCVTLWALSSESRQIWKRRWRLRTPKRVLQCLFSPDKSSFAVLLENDRRVRLWSLPRDLSTSKPEASCSLAHSRIVRHLAWRREPEEAGPTNAIVTRTNDGVVRLWTSVIDEPNSMRVWSTIDPTAMTSGAVEGDQACYYLDAFSMHTILQSSLQWLQRDLQMAEVGVGVNGIDQERILDLKRSRARRLEHLVNETPDMFALLQPDGTLIIRALANVDRKPPTLCQSFVVLKMASKVAIDPSSIFNISAHPFTAAASSDCYSPTGLLSLSLLSGEVVRYWITPSLLFDGLDDGLARIRDTCEDTTTGSLLTTQNRALSSGMLAIASEATEQDQSVKIQDTRSAFFSTGVQHVFEANSPVIDLAWSPSSTTWPSMLAVACKHVVYILCPRRVTYIDRLRQLHPVARWTVIAKVDLSTLGSLTITGIVWQLDYTLTVAASGLVLGYDGALESSDNKSNHLILLAMQQAGPLSDDDPEVILQSLVWGKITLALDILTSLGDAIDGRVSSEPLQIKPVSWERMVMTEMKSDSQQSQATKSKVLEDTDNGDKDRDEKLAYLSQLLDTLRGEKISCFSTSRQVQVADLLETTMLLQRHSTLLDIDALRYLACLRHLNTVEDKTTLALDYKSFVWAYQSKTQERLLQTLDVFYDGKMDWNLARSCGVFLWLRSQEELVIRAEQVARQQFANQDERDPTACSLLYYALGKQKLVANLWRQAFWHKDQQKMLAFLRNDFTEPRWQSASLKNAFALLSQRRFEMAASFFLLGGGLRDAVNVCTRNLNDLSLGIVIARLYEGGTNGPVFCDLLRKDVLQQALKTDNRWLAHWALSMLGEEEQALQVLCRPMHTLPFASTLNRPDEPLLTHEDAELALLFSSLLGSRPLPDDLPSGIESYLVLQANRTLCADGLDGLALAVLRTHKLKSARMVKKPEDKQISESSKASKVESHTLKAEESKAKVKVASLIQAAKPDSSKQAEMTFDVNSFNF